ncbi:tRNA lysidine(34) synthetase TilS [Comamonas endophytica]|uniref:tRNA(Ile)-lysidine synthase n=1 Tax=Comamonas endophytica TaxID=2949090 RepID=A0ABY6G985_9BURK|nr:MULTISPECIES: tRNA lysidine(34) synthetase TilS [unclassified Acidovorax]MCD2514560.1 tRNA lysidine(34) synthetase TilS [Acidovorax sp. D4N7]UYG51137.1 tRNA lysidine(34) synthetase TilS [Acidovorax sp. 5MLIR]
MSQSFESAMAAFAPPLPLAVALSGGADSTALLLACAERWPGQVHAIHVHHGLQAAADDFQRHCEALCARLEVPLAVCRVDARHAPGQSPEDAARQSRYAALAEAALQAWPGRPMAAIALAQHADDQVETLLLALSRGAGVAGLAAMPAQWRRLGLHWQRPLLQVEGAALRDWLMARGQQWVEDPSNADQRFTRNRIRAQLLPQLQAAFPQFRATFARSSRHCAQAAELLQEVAETDLAAIGDPPRIAALQALSRARQANVLRHWLRIAHGTTPAAAQLEELLRQLAACTTRGHQIRLKLGRGFVVRSGALLGWYNP